MDSLRRGFSSRGKGEAHCVELGCELPLEPTAVTPNTATMMLSAVVDALMSRCPGSCSNTQMRRDAPQRRASSLDAPQALGLWRAPW